MTKRWPFLIAAALLAASPLAAQTADVEAARDAGTVGEQADGYLGFARPPAPGLRAEVEAINIKRREGYTRVAQTRNVSIESFAASIGCRTLAGLRQGRAYNVGGAWGVKGGGPVPLPAHCGG